MSKPRPYQLHVGDCVDVLRTLPAESVDAVVTSPPYAMQRKSTYGGIPEKDYPDWTVAWMNEVRRVLKDDGSVIINISPHKVNGGLSDYVLRTRLALRDVGWTEIDELIWDKPNPMPTGSPRRPRRSWESLLWFGKDGKAWSDAKANGTKPKGRTSVQTASAHQKGWSHSTVGGLSTPEKARCRNVATVGINEHVPDAYKHPAKFPVALAEWCAKLICPPGGTVLDPFTGSSSTGVAAIRNGWQFIGIDQSAEYIDLSRRRLDAEIDNATIERTTT